MSWSSPKGFIIGRRVLSADLSPKPLKLAPGLSGIIAYEIKAYKGKIHGLRSQWY